MHIPFCRKVPARQTVHVRSSRVFVVPEVHRVQVEASEVEYVPGKNFQLKYNQKNPKVEGERERNGRCGEVEGMSSRR